MEEVRVLARAAAVFASVSLLAGPAHGAGPTPDTWERDGECL